MGFSNKSLSKEVLDFFQNYELLYKEVESHRYH
jgi:hypothetical protein